MQFRAASSDVVDIQVLATVTAFVGVSVLVLYRTVSISSNSFRL